MVNDKISDLLTRIRNANNSKLQLVVVPWTKMTLGIIEILKKEGYIKSFEFLQEGRNFSIIVTLKYKGKEKKPVITQLKRISKPGMRVFTNSSKIPDILDKLGIGIISTSNGVMTTNAAKTLNLGGEFLCKIY